MTQIIKIGRDKPKILTSPQLACHAANWHQGALKLRLWRTTRTNVSISYGVIVVDCELHLRRVTWMLRNTPDKSEYMDVMDTASTLLSESMFTTLSNELKNIHFPAFATLPMGLDGSSCGIESQSFPANVSLSWWGPAPSSWVKVEQWFQNVERTFQELLPPIPMHFPIGYRLR